MVAYCSKWELLTRTIEQEQATFMFSQAHYNWNPTNTEMVTQAHPIIASVRSLKRFNPIILILKFSLSMSEDVILVWRHNRCSVLFMAGRQYPQRISSPSKTVKYIFTTTFFQKMSEKHLDYCVLMIDIIITIVLFWCKQCASPKSTGSNAVASLAWVLSLPRPQFLM